jgi:catechol 2,3-dioxygenase-like lactoylglutathione lyase family enzyme
MGHSIVALDHVQLAMPKGKEDEAESFYSGVLGLTRLEKPAPLAQRGGCWFSNGPVSIHLGVEEDFLPAKKAHPALLIKDLALLVERCGQGAIEVRADHELEGVNRCYIDDPFGNRIELIDAS